MSRRNNEYFFGNNAGDARRLDLLSAAHDDTSMQWLKRLGVAPGWRCLEVGAGNGSLAGRISEVVGERGAVVATDLDIALLLDEEAQPAISVLQHDIENDTPLRAEFDLVHARMVLSHLRHPKRGLINMVRSLKPGGLLVVEDLDKTSSQVIEDAGSFSEDRRFIAAVVAQSGYDPEMGRRLPEMLRSIGLTDLFAEGFMRISFGGSRDPVLTSYVHMMERLLEREDIDDGAERLNRIRGAIEDRRS